MGHKAVIITEEAKRTTFIDSQINGAVEIAGKDTSFIRTSIKYFQGQANWLKVIEVVGVVFTVIAGIFTVLQYYKPGL